MRYDFLANIIMSSLSIFWFFLQFFLDYVEADCTAREFFTADSGRIKVFAIFFLAADSLRSPEMRVLAHTAPYRVDFGLFSNAAKFHEFGSHA